MDEAEEFVVCTNCWVEPPFFIGDMCMYCLAIWVETLEGDDDDEAEDETAPES